VSAVGGGYRAVRPRQAALGWFVLRLEPRRAHGEDAAFAFDHYVARVRGGLPHEGHPRGGAGFNAGAYQLGAGAGLPEPAASEHKPRPPITRRRELVGAGPDGPLVE